MIKLLICMFIMLKLSIAKDTLNHCEDKGLVLNNNSYDGLVIAINPSVEENEAIIENLKKIWTNASNILWDATNQRAYFGEITILVPKNWNSGSYGEALTETYEKSHVVVAEKNSAFGNTPYTVQFRECGAPGEYIHLTSDYIIDEDNFENKGKTMIHEWAHFRWGVYDEGDSDSFDKEACIEEVSCSSSLQGRNVVIDPETKQLRDCQFKKENNWNAEDGCMFVTYKNQLNPASLKINTSLMSNNYQEDHVKAFSHDNENDCCNMHNTEVSNEQNRLCKQRSVWDVMGSSKDFNNNNPSNPRIQNIEPTFKVVRASIPRFVLILDTSGSMNNLNDKGKTRFHEMIKAAVLFVEDFAPNGSAVGIIDFSTGAEVVAVIQEVDSIRANLSNSLKNILSPIGGTCIGCGIEKGIEMLKSSNFNVAGAHMIVLTDGEDPDVEEVENLVYTEKVIVDPIFFGVTNNEVLERLHHNTCGNMFPAGTSDSQQLIEVFKALSNTGDGDLHNKIFQIFGDSDTIKPSNGYVYMVVYVDPTIGKNTVFTFSWSNSTESPKICLEYTKDDIKKISCCNKKDDNTEIAICSDQYSSFFANVINNEAQQIVKFEIEEAQSGLWEFSIYGPMYTNIDLIATTMAKNSSVDPIDVKSFISVNNNEVAVYAKVSQGQSPIIGATVEATFSPTKPTQDHCIYLRDNGAIPDIYKNDGVYSGLAGRNLISSTRYSVKVTVTGAGNETYSSNVQTLSANINHGYIDENDNVVLNPKVRRNYDEKPQKRESDQQYVSFRRIEYAGGFSYSGPVNTPGTDNYPPNQVIDLSVKQNDPLDPNKGVLLTFTSPGDDYGTGTASSYEIRYTYNSSKTLITSFESATLVKATSVLSGNISDPSVANSIENFLIKLDDIPQDEDIRKVAFALRATDDAGNTADVSNVAMMNLFLKPPAVACTDENGYPISGDPFEKPGDCSHFYQCSHGTLHTKKCNDDTVFNPAIGTCDHPYNVEGCGKDDNNNVEPTTDSAPSEPPCYDDDGKPTSTMPFPNKNDCSRFYQCSNGYLHSFECPSGLVFNPAYSVCDWSYNVPGC